MQPRPYECHAHVGAVVVGTADTDGAVVGAVVVGAGVTVGGCVPGNLLVLQRYQSEHPEPPSN